MPMKKFINDPEHLPTEIIEGLVLANADKVALTGKKWDKKVYYRHTGYLGGLKQIST